MSARIIFEEVGSPKVLQLIDVDPGEPGPGEVRIRVEAIGVNPFDWKVAAGLIGWYTYNFPETPGGASSGIVDAVGEGVTEFAVGDAVISGASKAYQSVLIASVGDVVARPVSIDADQGAALPVSATTGYALVEHVGVGPDDVLLVNGGSGPVGAAAVQIAVARGAKVIATGSPANLDYIRSLGATALPYGEGVVDAVRSEGGVTAVVSTADGEEVSAITAALLPDLSRAATAAYDQFAKEAGIAVVTHLDDELEAVARLAADGVLPVRIGHVLPLAEAAQAFELSYKGQANGKIILHP